MRLSIPPRSRPVLRAFSLLELLVVVAIVAVLAAIALPALGRAHDVALNTKCQSNLRQIWVGLLAYRADHDGAFPKTWDGTSYWFNVLAGSKNAGGGYSGGYVSPAVFACPAGNTVTAMSLNVPLGYAMTDLMVWYPSPAHRTDTYQGFFRNLRRAQDWPVLCDADTPQVTDFDSPLATVVKTSRFTARHGGHANVLMGDGHVEQAQYGTLQWTQSQLNDGSYY